jgi:hypothetical protein
VGIVKIFNLLHRGWFPLLLSFAVS